MFLQLHTIEFGPSFKIVDGAVVTIEREIVKLHKYVLNSDAVESFTPIGENGKFTQITLRRTDSELNKPVYVTVHETLDQIGACFQ